MSDENKLLDLYKADLDRCPQYSHEEFATLWSARNYGEMTRGVLPLIFQMAGDRFWQRDNCDLMEMVSLANEAVLASAPTWSPDGGTQWPTWAGQVARGRMRKSMPVITTCATQWERDEDGVPRVIGHGYSLDDPLTAQRISGDAPAAEDAGEWADWQDYVTTGEAKDPYKIAEHDDIIADVRGKLASLPDRQAEAVELYFLCDMTEREVAQELGISPKNAHKLITKGVARLQNQAIIET